MEADDGREGLQADLSATGPETPANPETLRDMLKAQDNIFAHLQHIPNPVEAAALKPGWKTTEGQLVGLATAIIGLFVAFRWVSTGNAATITGHVVAIVQNIGPLIILYGIVRTYINSRGKLKSNAVKAQAFAGSNPPRLITTTTPAGTTTSPADPLPAALMECTHHADCAPAHWVSRRLEGQEQEFHRDIMGLHGRLAAVEQATASIIKSVPGPDSK